MRGNHRVADKILTVVGARPQFIKAAVLSGAIQGDGSMSEVLVHTGQHFDLQLSQLFFDELRLPLPKYNLGVHGRSHGEMTARMLLGLERVILREKPTLIVVYGDTNSTLAAALAASKLGVPVAHVEAGLRSFDRQMPEEINRVITDHVSEVLFCPSRTATRNLRQEGIVRGVYWVGDVMFDAALEAQEKAAQRSQILERLHLESKRYAVATIHRQENTDDRLKLSQLLHYLREEARRIPILFPIHPRTEQARKRAGFPLDGLISCEPLGYFDMAHVVANAAVIYTDSGGLQKEAYFYRVPCVTLRDQTEWVETISSGWNRLWTVNEYAARRQINDYGDGHASNRIVATLKSWLAAKRAGTRPFNPNAPA